MMRTRWLGVGLALLFGTAAQAQAPAVLYTATVIVAEAEVRSGASNTPQMYVTSKLHKGDKVEVLREANGEWVAIKPPVGSFSWINARFVTQFAPGKPMWKVVADSKEPLLIGSAIKTDRPTVEGMRVSRGHILKSVGPLRLADDGYWLPVEPDAEEVRFIRAEFVSRKPIETVAGTPPGIPLTPDAPPAATPPGQFAPPPAVAPDGPPAASPTSQPGVNPLWMRAQQEEQAGHYNEAIQLYRQLGSEAANSNHSLSMQAYNRAQWISDSLAQRPPSRTDVARPVASAQTPAGTVRSGAGYLRRAGRSVNVNPLFILENSQGQPLIYAVAMPNHSLDFYEGRMVALIGVRQYRNDLQAYLMTVMQVDALGK